MKMLLVLLGVGTLAGCNLKGMISKADDAGPVASASAAGSASAAPSATTAATTAQASDDGGAVAAKNAAPAATASAAKKSGVPTCAKGQQMGSEALSPLKPFCGAPCKTDADCKGVACTSVNSLGPDGLPAKSGPEYVKLCDPEYKLDKPAASASAAAAGPGKCAKNQHWDDITKKCRALGDCPPGYHWNDPMQTCLMQ